MKFKDISEIGFYQSYSSSNINEFYHAEGYAVRIYGTDKIRSISIRNTRNCNLYDLERLTFKISKQMESENEKENQTTRD